MASDPRPCWAPDPRPCWGDVSAGARSDVSSCAGALVLAEEASFLVDAGRGVDAGRSVVRAERCVHAHVAKGIQRGDVAKGESKGVEQPWEIQGPARRLDGNEAMS